MNQLGGKIHIRSELGSGTDVEITLPIEAAVESQAVTNSPGNLIRLSSNVQKAVTHLRDRAAGKSVAIARDDPGSHEISRPREISWGSIERYLTDWFGFHVKTITGDEPIAADLIITDKHDICWNPPDTGPVDGKEPCSIQRVLVIHNDMTLSNQPDCKRRHRLIGNISSPVGPFKLARCILALLDQDVSTGTTTSRGNQSDAGTQTPLASPEELISISGIALTDYGFTPMTTLASTSESSVSQPSSIQESVSSLRKQDDGMDQALSTIRGMSALNLQLPPSSKPTLFRNLLVPKNFYKQLARPCKPQIALVRNRKYHSNPHSSC